MADLLVTRETIKPPVESVELNVFDDYKARFEGYELYVSDTFGASFVFTIHADDRIDLLSALAEMWGIEAHFS